MPKAPAAKRASTRSASNPLARADENASKKPAAGRPKKGTKGNKGKGKATDNTSIEAEIEVEPIESTVESNVEVAEKTTKNTDNGKATVKATLNTAKESTESSTNSKTSDAVESYLLLTRLTDSDDPCITRLLSVSSDLNFEQLHKVMQIAFGWASCHAWSFEVSRLPEPGTFVGATVMSLSADDDMAEFMPDPESCKVAAEHTLKEIYSLPSPNDKVSISYVYDNDDSWEHDIVLLGTENPNTRTAMQIPQASEFKAVCLGGEGHPCAEDSGGAPGWEHLKALFRNTRKKDEDGRKQWYKTICANGDKKGLDPWKWDVFEVNNGLAELFGVEGEKKETK